MDWSVFCSLQTWCHFVHFSEKLCRKSPNRSTGNGFASRTASCAISNSEGWYFGAANLYLGAWKFVPHINPKVFFGHNQNSSILLKKHLQHFLQCLVKMNPFRRIFFQLGWIHLTLVDFDWWWEWKATTQVAYMAMTSTYVPSRAFRVSHKSFTHLRWESGQISYPAILQIEG